MHGRGVCAACGRRVYLTKHARTQIHTAPGGELHVDDPAVGITPTGPRRRTTCLQCGDPLTRRQIAGYRDHCSRGCAKTYFHATHPGVAVAAGKKGWESSNRRAFIERLRARLGDLASPIVAKARAGTLTMRDVLKALAAAHRRGYANGSEYRRKERQGAPAQAA
jgi:hypothetical protein